MWVIDNSENKFTIGVNAKEKLVEEQTPFQKIEIYDTDYFGTLFMLDDVIMLSEKDEFVYHEMITHMAMCTHDNPKEVLVIGGGDGGTIREILKHESVVHATLCEIDERVVRICQKYFPNVSNKLEDPKVSLKFEDGFKFLDKFENHFDIIITDSSDPVGPGVNLFKEDYYRLVKKALKPDGIMVSQSESPWVYGKTLGDMTQSMCNVFNHVETYIAMIPLYPSGCWTLTFASDHYSLKNFDVERSKKIAETCKYYSPEMHKAAITLPKFVEEIVNNK